MTDILNNSKMNKLIVFITFLFSFIIPTSFRGELFGTIGISILWFILLVLIAVALLTNKISKKSAALGLSIILYLGFVTLVATSRGSFYFSFARFVPAICAPILFSIVLRENNDLYLHEMLITILCGVIIVWNLLTLVNFEPFQKFVVHFYTEFYKGAVEGQFARGKPVFTFGVHNVAAFFYTMLFIMTYNLYKVTKRLRYVVFMISLFSFNILLQSSTSFGLAFIMVGLLFSLVYSNRKLRLIFIIVLIIGVVLFVISPLFKLYFDMLFSPVNGLIPRYFSENTVFSQNFEIMKSVPLGIGYTIPRGDMSGYFADSGYLVYYFMGNFPYVLFLIAGLFLYFINNGTLLPAIPVILTILLFELSMPSMIYFKAIHLLLYLQYFLKSITLQHKENEQGLSNRRLMMNKIDIVVAWVDGSDPAWREERKSTIPRTTFAESQYRDWGLLKYWFRGIELNAPWVNKIHFVTWGHLPDFLDVNHPKLEIVRHQDYIPNEYLPTFSANPIEMNFHRIENLSEQFVYFNDDMYLVNQTSATDFFIDGKPRDVAILNPIVPTSYDTISGIMINDIGLINKHFKLRESIKSNPSKWFNLKYRQLNLLNLLFLPWKNVVGLYQQHLPSSLLKSVYEEVWEKEFDVLNGTSLNSVRDVKRDVNQWLIKEWQVMQGKFVPRSIKFGKYLMVRNAKEVNQVKKAMNSNIKTICVNDHVSEDIDKVMKDLVEAFEIKFPNKSKFEK